MTFHNPTESVVRNAMRKHYIHFYLYRWWYRATHKHVKVFCFITGTFFGLGMPMVTTDCDRVLEASFSIFWCLFIAWGILATLDYVFQRARLDKAFETTNEILRHNREVMISRATFNEIITHLGYNHA